MKELYDILVPMIYSGRVTIPELFRVFPYLRRKKLIELLYYQDHLLYRYRDYDIEANKICITVVGRRTGHIGLYIYLRSRGFDHEKYIPALKRLVLAGL